MYMYMCMCMCVCVCVCICICICVLRGDTYTTTPPYLIQTDDPRPIGLQIEINH